MYFQNPPTNFIDKFVLIINPLQMNVNFFLGHQCKILRLYFGLPTYNIALFTCIRQSQQLNKGLLSDCGHLISYKNAKARTGVHIYPSATPRE